MALHHINTKPLYLTHFVKLLCRSFNITLHSLETSQSCSPHELLLSRSLSYGVEWTVKDDAIGEWLNNLKRKNWKKEFTENGYLVIDSLIEQKSVILYQEFYQKLLNGDIDATLHRHDLGSFENKRNGNKENVCQIMWPSLYASGIMQGPIHRRTSEIAKYLLGADMEFDFDMLIAKAPYSNTPVPWHQDEAYWNNAVDMPDKRAASFWVALDDATVDNGCMWFVPGSHALPLRKHWPAKEGNHTLMCNCSEKEGLAVPISSGSCTIHHGRTLHYTRGNITDRIRRAFIINYRPKSMIEFERKHNFDHGKQGVHAFKK